MALVQRVLGYDLELRDLSWFEDPGLMNPRKALTLALVSVNGHRVSAEQADRIISAFQDKPLDALWLSYQNKRPQDRMISAEPPWCPPKPKTLATWELPSE